MTNPSRDLILDQLRAADPVVRVPGPSQDETDAALTRILAIAVSRRRRRRLISGAVALATVVAGVALLINNPGSPGPGRPSIAQARAILRAAAAGLAVPAGAVLHTAYTGAQPFPNGRSTRWREETWQETSPPYSQRYIFSPAGDLSEQYTITDGRLQLYDPQRNTIYTGESPPPYTVRPAARAGRYLLTPTGASTITITAAQLHGLRNGLDTIVLSHPSFVTPYTSIVNQPIEIRKTALALLGSRHAQVQDHVQFAGHAANEISGPGQIPGIQNSYYVTPGTYQPLGLVQHFHGTTVRLQYTAYQLLPGRVANRALVTLAGAHPSARIDTSTADYNAASDRLLK